MWFNPCMAGLTTAPTQTDALDISWMTMCYESKVVFSWTPLVTNCFYYSITSSNCGSCPTTSTDTNITCTDVPMNSGVCRLYVQAVICGGMNITTPDPVPWQLNIDPQCSDTDRG